MMPEILPDHVSSPRTALFWDGTAYRPGTIDAAGHIQIDVLGNANLDGALQSVATNRLIVRGEDQLFSLKEPLYDHRSAGCSAIDGYLNSNVVPANTIWVVTRIASRNTTRATTEHRYEVNHNVVFYQIGKETGAFAAGVNVYEPCRIVLGPNDYLRVYYIGALLGNTVSVTAIGYQMTLET